MSACRSNVTTGQESFTNLCEAISSLNMKIVAIQPQLMCVDESVPLPAAAAVQRVSLKENTNWRAGCLAVLPESDYDAVVLAVNEAGTYLSKFGGGAVEGPTTLPHAVGIILPLHVGTAIQAGCSMTVPFGERLLSIGASPPCCLWFCLMGVRPTTDF